MSYLLLILLVPRERLAMIDDGRCLLQRFLHYFPKHIPEKFADAEPLKHVLGEGDLNHVLQFWGPWAFMAERKRHPCSFLDINEALGSPYTPHRKIVAHLQFDENRKVNNETVREFVYEISNAFGAGYAAAHISPRAWAVDNIDAVLKTRPSLVAMITEIRTKRLGKNIPNLYWLTVFGAPYVELFGEDKILTTPAHEVRKLPYGGIGVELTPGIEDTMESWLEFESVRDRAKRHLGSNAFFDKPLPSAHVYNAPDFGIPKDSLAERRERLRTTLTAEMAGGKSAYDAMLDNPGKRTKPS